MSAEPLRMMEGGAGFGPDEPTPGAVAGGARHVRIPYNVFACTYLSHGAIVLYGWLQQHCGERGCFPSYDTLAKKMGCSARAVSTYRQELEDAGVLRHERGGGARANDYTLTPDGLRDKSAKSANLSPVPDPPKSAKSASASLQNLPLTHAKSAYQSDPSIRPIQSEADPTDQPSTREARPAESPPAATKPAATPRQPRQPSLTAEPPSAEVGAVLIALGMTATDRNVSTFTTILSSYPDLDHRLLAALCADGCARRKQPATAQVYAGWCKTERAKNQANGDNGAESRRAHRPAEAVRAPADRRDRRLQGVPGGPGEAEDGTRQLIRAQRAYQESVRAELEAAGACPFLPDVPDMGSAG